MDPRALPLADHFTLGLYSVFDKQWASSQYLNLGDFPFEIHILTKNHYLQFTNNSRAVITNLIPNTRAVV
jgi:hypothetical protein